MHIGDSDHRGYMHIFVGKESMGREGIMSQKTCHEIVLRQVCMKQCVDELNAYLGLQGKDRLQMLKTSVLNVPALKRSFLLTPFTVGKYKNLSDVCVTNVNAHIPLKMRGIYCNNLYSKIYLDFS